MPRHVDDVVIVFRPPEYSGDPLTANEASARREDRGAAVNQILQTTSVTAPCNRSSYLSL